MLPVVLCGPLCAGKTTIADGLSNHGWSVLSARRAIRATAGDRTLTRDELRELGIELERHRPGVWLAEAAIAAPAPVVVDSARTAAQVRALRASIPAAVVIFVDAPFHVRRARFMERADQADANVTFEEIAASVLEHEAERLGPMADRVVNTAGRQPNALVSIVATIGSASPDP